MVGISVQLPLTPCATSHGELNSNKLCEIVLLPAAFEVLNNESSSIFTLCNPFAPLVPEVSADKQLSMRSYQNSHQMSSHSVSCLPLKPRETLGLGQSTMLLQGCSWISRCLDGPLQGLHSAPPALLGASPRPPAACLALGGLSQGCSWNLRCLDGTLQGLDSMHFSSMLLGIPPELFSRKHVFSV